jgi:hypothetical protein
MFNAAATTSGAIASGRGVQATATTTKDAADLVAGKVAFTTTR